MKCVYFDNDWGYLSGESAKVQFALSEFLPTVHVINSCSKISIDVRID